MSTDGGTINEYVYALTKRRGVWLNQRPNSSWGFQLPLASDGLMWHIGPLDVSEEYPYLWMSRRSIPQNMNWTRPELIVEWYWEPEFRFTRKNAKGNPTDFVASGIWPKYKQFNIHMVFHFEVKFDVPTDIGSGISKNFTYTAPSKPGQSSITWRSREK